MRPSVSATVARVARDLGSHAEATTLVSHVLGVTPAELLLREPPSGAESARLDSLVEERRSGIPLQHLTGVAHFRRVSVAVGPGVFIPRPETELLAGFAIDRAREVAHDPVIVELGAGSGAISLAISDEVADASIHAVEVSEEAWPYLARNLVGTSVDARLGDMVDAFSDLDGRVDVVVANPPYIPLGEYFGVPVEVREHDPLLALFSGEDGLDAMRVVADVAARLLRPGGWVCAEHADAQGESAPMVFTAQGSFSSIADHLDLNGRPRYVVGRRTGRMGP